MRYYLESRACWSPLVQPTIAPNKRSQLQLLCVFSSQSTDISIRRTRLLLCRTYLSQKSINFTAFPLSFVRSCRSVALITKHTWLHSGFLGERFSRFRSVMGNAPVRYVLTDLVSTHAHNHYNYSLKNVSSSSYSEYIPTLILIQKLRDWNDERILIHANRSHWRLSPLSCGA